MKKNRTIFSTLGLLALAFSSCSTYTLVDSQVYNNADLANYHTFRIITPGEGKLPPGMELVTYYNIAAAIREQMVERGYIEDPMSPIVVNIGVTVQKQVETTPVVDVVPSPAPLPPFPGPNANGEPSTQILGPPPGGPGPMPAPAPGGHFFPYHGPAPVPPAAPFFMMPRPVYWNTYYTGASVVTGIYKEGVLTMDIVDMNTKTPLFSASVSTILENGDAQFRNLSGIAQAVQTLFKKFPVPLLPQYRK